MALSRIEAEDRRITEVCILHIEATGSIPSIRQLTEVAFVCDRRLRQAFQNTFGVAPSRYFRRLALDRARERLIEPADGLTVSDVALDAGFGHPGRFSHYHKTTFGELPSKTLASA